jgi:hypothetical protein
MYFSRTTRTLYSDPTEFLNSPENPWREATASCYRSIRSANKTQWSEMTPLLDTRCHSDILNKQRHRFLSFELSLSNKTLVKSIEQVWYLQTSPPVTVDGVFDQKPSKSPCERNPPASLLQLSSAKEAYPNKFVTVERYFVKLCWFIDIKFFKSSYKVLYTSNSKRFGIADNIHRKKRVFNSNASL